MKLLIGKVEQSDFYLDVAFSRASKAALELRGSKLKGGRTDRLKKVLERKISTIDYTIQNAFKKMLDAFPRTENLNEFYQELIRCTIGLDDMKIHLAKLLTTSKNAKKLSTLFLKRLKKAKGFELETIKSQFYGRFSSIIKGADSALIFLEQARRELKAFPVVKEIFSVCITGFPNVGKTTLFTKLTGSEPEINSYAFTTKSINISYIKTNKHKIQLMDTPGTLNREENNPIEQQAHLALKHVADVMVYVFDLTEPYPLEQQWALFESTKTYNKPLLVYLTKTDILDEKVIEAFKADFATKASQKLISNQDELDKELKAREQAYKAELEE